MAREIIATVPLGAFAQLRLERGRRGNEPVVVLQPCDIITPARVAVPSKAPAALTVDQVAALIKRLRAAERQLRE